MPKEPARPVTEAEFRRLLSGSGRELRRVLNFCREARAAPGEVRHLTPADVDIARRVVTLRCEGSRTRVVQLNDDAAAQLGVLLRQMTPRQTHLFVNTDGKPWKRTTLARALQTARTRAKLPPEITLYALARQPLTPSPELPRPSLADGVTAYTIDAPDSGPALFQYTDRGGKR